MHTLYIQCFLLQAFAIFCGMGINNTQMYETAVRAMAKQRIAFECLSYHATAPADEAMRLKVNTQSIIYQWSSSLCHMITIKVLLNFGFH